jgi:hypothetical protein
MGDRGEMKDRIILDRGVEPGVIAERSFRPHLARLDVTFQDEIDIARNFQVDGFARHQLDRFLADESGEKNFIEPIRQRRGRRESVGRIAAEQTATGIRSPRS